MSIRRIFITTAAVMSVSAVFADSASVTSKKYVDDIMTGYQNKIPGSGTNKLMIYDSNESDGINQKAIVSSLGENTSATDVPNVGAVLDGLGGKQETFNGTAGYVMTGMGTDRPGEVGERAIYSVSTNYTDALVTAETVNTAVTNAVNSSLIRVDANGNPDDNGLLWQISDYLLAINAKVPYGYTELQYIESDGTQYIDTGFVPNADYTHKIVFNMLNTGTAGEYLCGTNSNYGRSGNVKAYDSKIVAIYAGTTSAIDISNSGALLQTTTPNTLVMNLKSNAASEVFLNGTDISSGQVVPVTSTSKLYLFHLQALSTGGAHARIYNDKIYQNGSLIRNFVPAKNSSDVVGMYDTVSGTFFTNAGTSTFTAGPSCISPNLANMVADNITLGKYISAQGEISDSVSNFIYNKYIPVKPNTKYTLSFNAELYFVTISEYSSGSDSGFIKRNQGSNGGNTYLTITTGATTQYLRWGSNPYGNDNTVTLGQVQSINWMLTEGDTVQTYRPYGENICH